jgi:hypothetical protein
MHDTRNIRHLLRSHQPGPVIAESLLYRLLAQLDKYQEEVTNAYKQAEVDVQKDFDKLNRLLKEYMYQWWD